jgi:hypothetical protein
MAVSCQLSAFSIWGLASPRTRLSRLDYNGAIPDTSVSQLKADG